MSRFACFALLSLLLLANSPGPILGQPAPERSTLHLQQLSNKELLEQLQTAFHQASGSYLAELRKLAAVELLLNQIRKQAATVEVPALQPEGGTSPALPARQELDRAQARVLALKQKLDLAQKEKVLLENQAQQFAAAAAAATAFLDKLDQLQLHFLEVKLRLDDGTLKADAVPKPFDDPEANKRKQALLEQQRKLKQREDAVRAEVAPVIAQVEATGKALIEAETHLSRAGKLAARAQQEQKLDQAFAAQSPAILTAQWDELQQERVGLKGALGLSQGQFRTRLARQQRTEQALKELPAPPAVVLQIQRPEDVEPTAKAAEALIKFHTRRQELLAENHAALQGVIAQGETVGGDGTVLGEHLFKMQVLATVLARLIDSAKLPATTLPAEERAEVWAKQGQQLAKELTGAETLVRQAQAALKVTAEEIKKSQAARAGTQDRLEQLKRFRTSATAGFQLEARLKDLDGKALLEDFLATDQAWHKALAQQQRQQQTLATAQDSVDRVRTQLQALQDPLLRQAQEAAGPEKQKILAELFKAAKLDPPTSGLPPASGGRKPPEEGTAQEQQQASGGLRPPLAESARPALAEPDYRTLLATRVRVVQELNKLRTDLAEQLTGLGRQLEQYLAALTDSRRLALQRQGKALEIRKRLGTGKLEGLEMPEGINEALKRDPIVQLESATAEALQRQDRARLEQEALVAGQKHHQEIAALLSQVETLVGKRQDLLQDLKKLGADLERPLTVLAETERKTLEQQAIRRLEDEDATFDWLLSVAPSQRAEDLTGLLKSYYTELLDLHGKKDSLQTLRDKLDQLVKLAQEEKAALGKIVPQLVKDAAAADLLREEETLRIRVVLEPGKAEELIKQFEQRTGRRFTAPLGGTAAVKPELVQAASERILEAHVLAQALAKWQRLFEQRLAETGLDREIGQYQDRLGELKAREATLLRRVQNLSGATEPGPSKGEIPTARAARLDVRQEAALRLGATVLAVLVGAVLVNWLAGLALRRYARNKDPESVQTAFALSLCRALFRFAVWMTALILILSTLGFNIVAILAGLGIGGLAIGLAAQETIADLLGGIMIFVERPFKIGDTIQIGQHPPAKVVGMTWRTTRLQDAFGQHASVPNRQSASAVTQNFTREVPSKDSIAVHVAVKHDPARVIQLIEEVLSECPTIISDRPKGVILEGLFTQGEAAEPQAGLVLKYVPWWYVEDYHRRHGTREDLWKRLWQRLGEAGMIEGR